MTSFRWTEGLRGAVAACDARLEAVAFGPPPDQAPTIVMLHEGLGCVALWRDFPAILTAATGLGVFVYSRAGYGGSEPIDLPRPLDYMSREARFSLPAVLEAIGLEHGILLGHSDGASIAAIHAGEHADERIKGLVLMAPHLFAEAMGLASIAAARKAYETGDLRARLAKYHAHVDCAFRGWNDSWLDPGFEAWNIEDAVDRWRVPALVIQGADDQYGTLKQIRAIETRSPAPVESLILEDCRHSPQFDQPRATIEAIVQFCARVAPAPARRPAKLIGQEPPNAGAPSPARARLGRSKRP